MTIINDYSTGFIYDHPLRSSKYFYNTGHWAEFSTLEVAILHAAAFFMSTVKLPSLQLKTWPKQLLGPLPLVIALPGEVFASNSN